MRSEGEDNYEEKDDPPGLQSRVTEFRFAWKRFLVALLFLALSFDSGILAKKLFLFGFSSVPLKDFDVVFLVSEI